MICDWHTFCNTFPCFVFNELILIFFDNVFRDYFSVIARDHYFSIRCHDALLL